VVLSDTPPAPPTAARAAVAGVLRSFPDPIPTLQQYVLYSFAAYRNDSICSWNCDYCTPGFVPFATVYGGDVDGFAFLGYNPATSEIVVSFRGSHSLANFIEDLETWKEQVPFAGMNGGNVHSGFYRVYESLGPTLLDLLAAMTTILPDYNIVVTGHSLGAGLASLLALDMLYQRDWTAKVVNFGSPRVGDDTYAKFFASSLGQMQRLVHANDVVPHLPPHFFNFEHENTEFWCHDLTCQMCPVTEDPSCSWGVPILKYSIADHLKYLDIQYIPELFDARTHPYVPFKTITKLPAARKELADFHICQNAR